MGGIPLFLLPIAADGAVLGLVRPLELSFLVLTGIPDRKLLERCRSGDGGMIGVVVVAGAAALGPPRLCFDADVEVPSRR